MPEEDYKSDLPLQPFVKPSSSAVDLQLEPTKDDTYYYLERDGPENQTKTELVRIATCAVFHKFGSGKGVPHSFAGEMFEICVEVWY